MMDALDQLAATAGERMDPLFLKGFACLMTAVLLVPLAKRLGLGTILGYLVGGALIGPNVLAIFSDAEAVIHFAEFGVVLLLFVIGLELRFTRLWRWRADIFGLGAAQVMASGAAITGVLWLAGWRIEPAVAAGAALALSSTAFAVQLMRARGTLTSPHGDRAFSVLLFQDLSIVPLLVLVSTLGPLAEGEFKWESAALGVGALGLVVVTGRFLLGPLFRAIARARADEVFTAAALFVVLGAALSMQAAGLSMAMGAFLAGVLLAESEFRHQIETDIEPFRGLLLGLFFMGVGMGIDWGIVLDNLGVIVGGALGLYVLKSAILIGLALMARSSKRDALRIGALLGQGGEFGFVLVTAARDAALWTSETASILAALITLSMALTPLAVALADRLTRRKPGHAELTPMEEAEPRTVIVAGFGRFGQVIARLLRLRGYDVTLIDNDPERIRIANTFGNKVFFGDLRRADMLQTAGIADARAVFLASNDVEANHQALKALRQRWPNLAIFARGADRFDQLRLAEAGATGVVRDTLESAVELSRQALAELEDDGIEDAVDEFRRRDAELLRLQSEFGAHEGLKKLREGFTLKQDTE